MTPESQESLSYQRMLRAIGAKLDEERPARFTILEVPGGFTVAWERRDPAPVLEEVHFSQATLLEKAAQLMRGRQSASRERSDHGPIADRREDTLRALGFEFDDSLAHGVLVCEDDAGLLVTYSYVDPTHGYAWRKHMVRLDAADIEQILAAAHDRRRRRKLLGFIR